jgi:hypothetical protein
LFRVSFGSFRVYLFRLGLRGAEKQVSKRSREKKLAEKLERQKSREKQKNGEAERQHSGEAEKRRSKEL